MRTYWREGDAEFYKAVVSHMKGNAGEEITKESARLNEMRINYTKIRSQAEALARRLMDDADLNSSRILGRNLLELEQNERTLREEIQKAERSIEDKKDARFDPDRLKGYLSDFTRVYEKMPLEKKRRLNHALFSGIVSYIKRGEDKGEIEIKLRGDGSLKRTWEDLKKENQVRQVRAPGSLGSARHTITQTSFCSESPWKSTILSTEGRSFRCRRGSCPRFSRFPRPPSIACAKGISSVVSVIQSRKDSRSTTLHFNKLTADCSRTAVSQTRQS